MSLAREFNDENLVPISNVEWRSLCERIESNYFLSITRDSRYMADNAVDIRRTADGRVLTVMHYVPKEAPGTGLSRCFKADKELWQTYQQLKAEKRWK